MVRQFALAQAGLQLTVKGPVTHHKQGWQMENFVTLDQATIVTGIDPAQPINRQLHIGL